jgi:hypothetical protein
MQVLLALYKSSFCIFFYENLPGSVKLGMAILLQAPVKCLLDMEAAHLRPHMRKLVPESAHGSRFKVEIDLSDLKIIEKFDLKLNYFTWESPAATFSNSSLTFVQKTS